MRTKPGCRRTLSARALILVRLLDSPRDDQKNRQPLPGRLTLAPLHAGSEPIGRVTISVRIRGDHFPSVPAAQALPDQYVDRIFDELDMPVRHQRIHTARVLASRCDVERQPTPKRVRPCTVWQSAPAVRLFIVGRPKMVVQAMPRRSVVPADSSSRLELCRRAR